MCDENTNVSWITSWPNIAYIDIQKCWVGKKENQPKHQNTNNGH